MTETLLQNSQDSNVNILRNTGRKILLVCGVASSLLYVAVDIAAAMRWAEYSYTSQAISELMAIGAPTRPFIVPLFALYGVLAIGFGIGVWDYGDGNRRVRATGLLLAMYGLVGFIGLLAAPMHLRGAAVGATDTMHVVVTTAIVALTLLFVAFGSSSSGKGFRFYSTATIAILLVFGFLSFLEAPKIAANRPTPWFGIIERVNVYTAMLWILVLAVVLLSSFNKRICLAAAPRGVRQSAHVV